MRGTDLAHTSLTGLVEWYVDLRGRDALARILTPDRRTAGLRPEPLTVAEHIELLATEEAIRQHVSHGRQAAVHAARRAGASWQDIAATNDSGPDVARRDFLRWIDGQAFLWDHVAGRGDRPIGLDRAARADARRLADSHDQDAALADIPDRKEVHTPS